MRSQAHQARNMDKTVWSQPPLAADTAERAVEARYGSERLLERMEASFAMFSRRHGVDYLDARTLLMNCAGVA